MIERTPPLAPSIGLRAEGVPWVVIDPWFGESLRIHSIRIYGAAKTSSNRISAGRTHVVEADIEIG